MKSLLNRGEKVSDEKVSAKIARDVKLVAEDALERANEAARLEARLQGQREELARLQKRYDTFTEAGAGHIMLRHKEMMGVLGMIEFDIPSTLTGNELAAKLEPTLKTLRAEIQGAEEGLETLLAELVSTEAA